MKFKIGEVAIVISTNKEYDGKECEILSYDAGDGRDYEIMLNGIKCSITNSGGFYCYENQLQKIDDDASWDIIEASIGWNPTRIKENVQ